MALPRLKKWQWGLLVCAIGVLLLPVGLTVAAPALAPLPAPASFAVEPAPPLPEREAPLPGFQNLLDPLPLVIRDLPDQASQDMVAAYDQATLLQAQPVLNMLAAAERAIPVTAVDEATWSAWLRELTSDSSDFSPIPSWILASLKSDPENGDRLSNLAIALYFAQGPANLETEGNPNAPLHSGPLVIKAQQLLDLTIQEFPDSRGAVINTAYMYFPGSYGDSARSIASDLIAWLDMHPDDVTALMLLTEGSSGADWPALTVEVESRLHKLAESPEAPHAALARALLGDLLQELARSQLPFIAQQTARQALSEYEQALALSDDPSVYAARAALLQFLGKDPEAIATLQQAIQISPESVPLRLQLAELFFAQVGNEQERQAAIGEARDIARDAYALALSQWDPLLRDIQLFERYVQPAQGPAVYVWSRPHRTYYFKNLPTGTGAGFIVSYDVIQRPDPREDPSPLPIAQAMLDTIDASIALGDPSGAADDIARFQQPVEDPGRPYYRLLLGHNPGLDMESVRVAQLVADASAQIPLDPAVSIDGAVAVLQGFGLSARAATLCRSREDWACLGENEYLAGNIAAAHQAFVQLEAETNDTESFSRFYALKAGVAADRAGDRDTAIRLYRLVAENECCEDATVARMQLGNLEFDAGNISVALEQYDELINFLQGVEYQLGPVESLVLQRTRNNRGVAQLMSQMHSGVELDCEGNADAVCVAALADFEAALLADPCDPVSLLGKGWVERLQGDAPGSIQTLERAVELDPTLFPGLNDLGVLAAQSGHSADARRYFEAALAANPNYDLALWNLGVLEMQRGISGVLHGQAYLARANLQNPSFVSSDLSYRFDDNVYRVEFNERSRPGAGWSFGSASSLAATTLGFVTVVTLILAAVKYAGTNQLQDGINKWTDTANEWEKRAFGRTLSWPTGAGWRRWLPVVVTLLILAFVTSWPALRANGSDAATVVLALFATLTAVITHQLGHLLVAWRVKAEIRPAQWGPGSLLALVLLPVNMSAGPFPGERIQCQDERSAWLVHLGGPLANLLVAVGTYALYLVQPMPGLRLIVLAQLAAMSYALLPFEPLDGATLSRYRPKVLGGLAFVVLLAGALFSLNIF